MMKKKPTILMTGAGGAAIPFLTRSLQKHGYRVLTADMDPFAGGLYVSDKGFVIPKADDPRFLPAIEKICSNEHVDVIIPLVDEELIAVAGLEGESVIPLIPRMDFIRTCLDKYTLIRTLQEHHIPAPRTVLATEGPDDIGYPCIVKPRTGRGSRDVGIIHTAKEFRDWSRKAGKNAGLFILQEYLYGTEYTVSVVAWRDGPVQAVVPKEIIAKKGITRFAVTRRHTGIGKYCEEIQEKLHGDGPFNVQLRCDGESGQPYLFEINPRYSTTVSLTILAGCEEIHGLIQQALNGPEAFRFTPWNEDIVLMRNNEDYAVTEEQLGAMRAKIRTMS